ncbi:NUDIX hydrolase [Candidatus Peregrinibacteria bacterium]|nr:MAG: NUDIX hydrolase [Candidatus Peregrinibacteria bacterium]
MINTMNKNINSTVSQYTSNFPQEAEYCQPLLSLSESKQDIASRKTTPDHVTCSGIVFHQKQNIWHVLMIHHTFLDKWLFPGGHIEKEDATLEAAAIREITEETGLPSSNLQPLFENQPIDINTHPIPENIKKNEPQHNHWDLRYAFTTTQESLTLEEGAITDARWMKISDVPETQQKIMKRAMALLQG